MGFADRVGAILEQGHWKVWDGSEPMHFIIDPASWPRYLEMDASGLPRLPKRKRGQRKVRRKAKRIAGKL